MTGEDLIRIEHKLDAILWILRETTGITPRSLPQRIPGMGGITTGVCPITLSPIEYHADAKTGRVYRRDALRVDIVDIGRIPDPPVMENTATLLSKLTGGEM